MNRNGKLKHCWSIPLLVLAISSTIPSLKLSGDLNKPKLLHIVAFQFNEDVSEARVETAIRDFENLEGKIPEIKKFEGGKNIGDLGLSQEFTHCFVLSFNSEEDRDHYLPHPDHQEVVEKNKPLINKLLVLDIWGD